MPTKEQIEAVLERLEDLVAPGMDMAEIEAALEGVDFEGFSAAQVHDIEQRIASGEAAEFWMDGVKPEGDMAKDDPHEPRRDRFAERDAKARELFDTANRVMAARFLEDHAFDLDVMLRSADEVRQTYLREAEKTWDRFREDSRSRTEEEIAAALGQFREMEASLGETKTLMDHLRGGGLFVDPALDPYAAAAGTAAPDGRLGAEGERAVRPLTQQLIDAAYLDLWPGHAAVVDFGIDSQRHLGALQFAIREELVTPQELDAAMGHGPKLTEIARRGENPYRDVTFRTSWDDLRLEESDSPPAGEANARPAADSPAQERRYQVWHANDPEAVPLSVLEREPYVHGYTPAARVEARDLGHAVELTRRTDQAGGGRPTAAGDVIVDPEGHAYRVEAGARHESWEFRPVGPPDGRAPEERSREGGGAAPKDAADPAHRAKFQKRDPDRGLDR